jgi:hypothetical protein
MIGRIWHGWTTPEHASAYEQLLRERIFPGIEAKRIDGYRGIQLFRRDAGAEVEFKTIMWFDSLEGARQLAGDDYERAYVPDEARALLARFDDRSEHYEIRAMLSY